ncbi:MAG TPA: hypothetical protein VJX70_02900 [Candidatus Acidoferrum sp.]|nr:hypothetical protein [Candidatus Acidoferrum sp.]
MPTNIPRKVTTRCLVGVFLLISAAMVDGKRTNREAPESGGDSDWAQIHQRDDQDWARVSKMSLADVQRLRRIAGVDDNTANIAIERMWPIGASNRYLVSTVAGDADCMTVGVYKRQSEGFLRIWAIDQFPGGGSLCRGLYCPKPRIELTENGEIKIEISSPGKNTERNICDLSIRLTYIPKDENYELVGTQSGTTECNLWTYKQALTEVFGVTTENYGRILTIEVLPSFRNEWAITFDRATSGLTVSKIAFDQQLWAKLGLGGTSPVRSGQQCLNIARDASATRNSIAIPQEEVQKLLVNFGKVDLHMDKCPRNARGDCIGLTDGTKYYVLVPNRRELGLSDMGNLSGASSENPALSAWVDEVIDAINGSH